jgi:hypothetical protein
LVDRLRAALAGENVTERKMFGGVCFMLNGNMLVCASRRGLLARVGKEGHAGATALPHARPMEMGGRPMQGYVLVAPEGTASDQGLRAWIARAKAYVDTLPPKAGTSRRPRG